VAEIEDDDRRRFQHETARLSEQHAARVMELEAAVEDVLAERRAELDSAGDLWESRERRIQQRNLNHTIGC
jgi:hypothetical protein